jgi:hypothetical protein
MEAYELRAYEVLGFWTLVLIRVWQRDDGTVERSLVYRGDHVPIDEEDPTLRAALLLHQVYTDLDWALTDHAAIVPSMGPVLGH